MTASFLATRREVLQQLGLAVGSITTALPAVATRSEAILRPDLADALTDLIRHPASAAIVGAAWLAEYGEGISAADLARQLDERLDFARTAPRNGVTASDLVELIRADFVSGDVVNLQGWILSRTEARICALYAA